MCVAPVHGHGPSDTALQRAYAIRWGIILGLVLIFSVFLVVAYTHANRRLSRNQPPLPYHRWLLPRHKRAIHEPRFRRPEANFTFYQQQQQQQQYQGNHGGAPLPPPPGQWSAPLPPTPPAAAAAGQYPMQPVPPPYNASYAHPPGYSAPGQESAPPAAAGPPATGDVKYDPFALDASGQSSMPLPPPPPEEHPAAQGIAMPPPTAQPPTYRY